MATWVLGNESYLNLYVWPAVQAYGVYAGVALFILLFGLRSVEGVAVGTFRFRQGLKSAIAWIRWKRHDIRHRRLWSHLRDMSESSYRRLVDRKLTYAQRLRERAQILDHLSERAVSGIVRMPLYAEFLRRRSIRYEAAESRVRARIDHWQALRQEIHLARETMAREQGKKEALRLMEEVGSGNRAAAFYALTQLNELRNVFDWLELTPENMPREVRDRLKKVYLAMVGTTNLSEAQSALGRAKALLSEWANRSRAA